MQIAIDVLLDFGDDARYIHIMIVVHIRLQCRMFLHIRMPYTIDSDVMQVVCVVILQEVVKEILYRSSLYGRNGQNA